MTTTKSVTQDEVGILLAAAGLAPSMHNTQPWRFEINGPVIDVLLDPDRTLPTTDPANRFIRIGLGAATFNLRVAAAMLGHDTTIAIDPDPATPDVVVRIFLADRPISSRMTKLLTEAARAERADLRWLDDQQRTHLGSIIRAADDRDLHEEDRLHERLRWIGGDRDTEGVPDSVLGPLPTSPAAVRDLSAGRATPHRSQAAFEAKPIIAVLATADDDETAWVRAGLALERVLLTATSYSLAASFLNQAIEYPPLRDEVHTLIGHDSWPQLIIRFGYPTESSGLTPRRPWNETLNYQR